MPICAVASEDCRQLNDLRNMGISNVSTEDNTSFQVLAN